MSAPARHLKERYTGRHFETGKRAPQIVVTAHDSLFFDQPLKALDEIEPITMVNSFELARLNHKGRTRFQLRHVPLKKPGKLFCLDDQKRPGYSRPTVRSELVAPPVA